MPSVLSLPLISKVDQLIPDTWSIKYIFTCRYIFKFFTAENIIFLT